MKPRIRFVAPSAYPLGGLATWLDYLVPGLASRGLDVAVNLVGGRWHDPVTYTAAHPALPVTMIVNPTGSREGRVRALTQGIVEAKPDLVASVNIPDLFAAVERRRMRGACAPRVAMTVHGIEADLFDDMREFREVLDGVVCTNRLACQLAVERGGMAADRVHYAPYGVEMPPRMELFPEKGELRISYVGRLEETQKRMSDLAAITERLEETGLKFILSIAGSGPDEEALRRRLAPQVGRGRVRFLGALPHAYVQERLYPETDILLLTSSWETGPIVIWEAMASGIPVVSSRYVGSGLEGALEHGVNCMLFDVGDINAAVACLLESTDQGLQNRIGLAGRDLVSKRYTIGLSVAKWAEVFDAVLRSPHAGCRRVRTPIPAAGRLDRWLGKGPAETLRRFAGATYHHQGPGGEWPHSYGRRPSLESSFFDLAARLDTGTRASWRP